MPSDTVNIIASKFHPLIILHGTYGFVKVCQIVDGEFITGLGPFRHINECYYDEYSECLAIFGEQNNVKLVKLSMKSIGRKKAIHKLFRPVIMHNFENKDDLLASDFNRAEKDKEELKSTIKNFITNKEVKDLITLEKTLEGFKAKVDLSDNFDYLLMMRKVSQLKYKNGMKKIAYNLVYEDFNFCNNIDKKFDCILGGTCLSFNKRFVAISVLHSSLYIFHLPTMKILHTIDDNLKFRAVDMLFTPDERLFIKADTSKEVKTWDMQRGEVTHYLVLSADSETAGRASDPLAYLL